MAESVENSYGPFVTEFWIQAPDHTRLLGRRWTVTPGPARARALIIHGLGEHSAYYDHVAREMNGLGIEVVCYDQRGFGRSHGRRGVIPADTALVDDAAHVFAIVAGEADAGAPRPYLVAHSMAGAMAAFAVTTGKIAPRALVLSSPAIEPQLPFFGEPSLRILRRILPDRVRDSSIDPNDLTHDQTVVAAILADPLMHRSVTPRLLVAMIDQGAMALKRAPSLKTPTLLLIAGDDRIVKAKKAEAFAAAMPAGHATVHVYPKLFHDVFHEVEADRQIVLRDFREWLQEH